MGGCVAGGTSRRARFLLAVLAVGGLVGVPLAGATSPGRDGRIAYARKDPAGHWQVWVASARLSGAKRLTNGRADSGWPVWSPDGKKIAFDSSRTDPAPGDSKHINDVFVMKADGSKVRKLTGSKGASADAAWSPDGSHIAFDADRGHYPARQGIYVMDASGRNSRGFSVPVRRPSTLRRRRTRNAAIIAIMMMPADRPKKLSLL